MAKTDSSDKLKKLQEQHERSRKRLEAFRHQQKAEEKKADSRRKVLIGEAVVQAVKNGKLTEQVLGEILDAYILKERDREFLGLAAKSNT
jgi:hypothetical protein